MAQPDGVIAMCLQEVGPVGLWHVAELLDEQRQQFLHIFGKTNFLA
jgi:hypothetical protein